MEKYLIKENKDKPTVEAFKFFEKTKKQKVSKTSSKKSKKSEPRPLIILPKRRTTRLKTEIFVETFPHHLPDGEYDINKEEFSSSQLSGEEEVKKTANTESPLELHLSDESSSKEKKNHKRPRSSLSLPQSKKSKTECSPNNLTNGNTSDSSREPVKNNMKLRHHSMSANESLNTDSNVEEDTEKKKNFKRPLAKRNSMKLKKSAFDVSSPHNSEFDLSQEIINTTTPGLEMVEKKRHANNPNENMFSDSNAEENEVNIRIDKIVESLGENQPKTNSKQENSFEQLTDSLFETIDTNAIVEMMQNTSLDSQQSESVEAKEPRSTKKTRRRRTHNENCLNSSDDQSDPKPKSPTKRGRKSLAKNYEDNASDVNDQDLASNQNDNENFAQPEANPPKSPIRRGRKSLIENCEEVNDNQNDNDDSQKSNIKSKSPKKRGRKSLPGKYEEVNDHNNLEYCDHQQNGNENFAQPEAIPSKSPIKRGRKSLIENSEEVNDDQNDNDDDSQKSDIKTKSPKKKGRKSLAEKYEEINDQNKLKNGDHQPLASEAKPPKSPIKMGRKSLIENCEEVNDDQNDNDDDSQKSDIKSKSPKKKGRKSLAEKYEEENDQNKIENGDHHLLPSIQNGNENFAQPPKTPTKRGRKSLTANSEEVNDQTDKSPKKKGRKSLAEKCQEVNEPNKAEDNKSDSTDNENVPKLKAEPKAIKKRGRKSLAEKLNETKLLEDNNDSLNDNNQDQQLNLTNNELNDTNSNKTDDKIPKTPKKRGRKPKNINNTAKEDKTEDKIEDSTPARRLTRSKSISIANNTADTTVNNSKDITNNESSSDTSIVNNEPRKRGRPRKPVEPKIIKVNVAKALTKKPIIKFSKVTKEQFKNCCKRKIPQHRLEEVLEMVDNDDHYIWKDRNISCNPTISTYWQQRAHTVSEQNVKLKYARQFLLRRDWIGLSKVLSLSNSESNSYYPLLAKYAAVLLAHTDSEQFNKYLQFLTNMNDCSAVIKKCTRIPKEVEE